MARYYRSKNAVWLLGGIAAFVRDSRVVALWRESLWGGSPHKDLTSVFSKDFTDSPATETATNFSHG